jgi:TonB family protein
MKKLIVLSCLFIMMGCSEEQIVERTTTLPTLLEQTELPPIPQRIIGPEFRLVIRMLVNEEGAVNKAKLLIGSGLSDWDSLALKSILKWKYEPATIENKPVSIWLVQKVRVQFECPCYIFLSQILCDSYDTALLVVSKLNEGSDFGELALKYSCDSTKVVGGFIGKKDVMLYPQSIYRVLKRLSVDQYTQPIEYGKRFAIFKRNRS